MSRIGDLRTVRVFQRVRNFPANPAGFERRVTRFLRGRFARLRMAILLIAQTVLATSAAWGLANKLIGSEVGVFAPIAALVTLAVSLHQQFRRTVEMVLGVTLGVFVGDAVVLVTGTGVWQLALIVSISMIAAILIGGGTTFVLQAAATGIIIATVTPVADLLFSRVIDVLIGAAVGLTVSVLLLPLNPIVVVRRAAARVLGDMAEALSNLGEALRARTDAPVRAAAEEMRAVGTPVHDFTEVVQVAAEAARLAPFRWRTRNRVRPFERLSERMDHVMRNLRVLTRRSRTLLGQREPAPSGIPDALDALARAVRLLLGDLLAERDPERARAELLRACRLTAALPEGATITAQVVVAQVRSTAVDLLRAAGLSYTDADKVVRTAVAESQSAGQALLPPRGYPAPAGGADRRHHSSWPTRQGPRTRRDQQTARNLAGWASDAVHGSAGRGCVSCRSGWLWASGCGWTGVSCGRDWACSSRPCH